MRRTFDFCLSRREYLAFPALPPARPPEEIDVCPAAKSCPFDRTYRLATLQSSANAAAQRPATVSPRWGGASAEEAVVGDSGARDQRSTAYHSSELRSRAHTVERAHLQHT